MRQLSFFSWALLGILTLTAHAADAINIGEFASLTGGTASFGQSSHKGTQLAIDEINAAGGVLGRPLNLITEDDQSKAGEPSSILQKLINNDHVVAILGEIASSRSLEGAPIAQSNQIPMISPGSTNPKVTQVGDYIFRICFLDEFQGKITARYSLDTLHAKTAAILTDVKQDYSTGLAEFFKLNFTTGGGKIVSEKSYSSGDKDFRAQLTEIKSAKPDVIFVPGYYNEVAPIAIQSRQLGIKSPMIGGDGWDSPDLVRIGGRALEGNFFSNHFTPNDSTPTVHNFVAKYQAKYGDIPDAMAALGYDSAKILADAIRRAGSTGGPALRQAIAATKNFAGVTGTITINAQRNADKSAVIIGIREKQFVKVAVMQP